MIGIQKIFRLIIWHPYGNQRNREHVLHALEEAQSGKTAYFEQHVQTSLNGAIYLEVVLNPVRDERHEVTHIVGILTDVTARKKAEEERLEYERRFLKAQKMESLGILAGGIAHDFNNLLMVILGNLEMSRKHISSESSACRALDHIEKAASKAAELTSQRLAYSGKGRFVLSVFT